MAVGQGREVVKLLRSYPRRRTNEVTSDNTQEREREREKRDFFAAVVGNVEQQITESLQSV